MVQSLHVTSAHHDECVVGASVLKLPSTSSPSKSESRSQQSAPARRYREEPDAAALVAQLEETLAEHNATSKRPMPLALFLFAAEHVARVRRVLRQPGGHALLVGVGGSGRQSLARLAAFASGMAVAQARAARLNRCPLLPSSDGGACNVEGCEQAPVMLSRYLAVRPRVACGRG
jgi:P-loop containing dynein motor region D4